jgi:ribosome modulation factor
MHGGRGRAERVEQARQQVRPFVRQNEICGFRFKIHDEAYLGGWRGAMVKLVLSAAAGAG